jgi:hypothetical protein
MKISCMCTFKEIEENDKDSSLPLVAHICVTLSGIFTHFTQTRTQWMVFEKFV